MAKQDGDIKLTGTISNITFYEMDGKFYARKKSSLNRKKFMRNAAFEGSRRSCKRLALGSQLASVVYRTLPEARRYYELYCELKSLAIKLLKEQKSEREVLLRLEKTLTVKQKTKRVRVKKSKQRLLPKLFTVVFVKKGITMKFGKRKFMRMAREGFRFKI